MADIGIEFFHPRGITVASKNGRLRAPKEQGKKDFWKGFGTHISHSFGFELPAEVHRRAQYRLHSLHAKFGGYRK